MTGDSSPESRRFKKSLSNTHDRYDDESLTKSSDVTWNRGSREKSFPRNRSRSNSRHRRSRSRHSRSRSRSRRRSRSRSPMQGARLHVADIDDDVRKFELNREFEKYGPLVEIWVARNNPRFAFVVFENQDDADTACEKCDGIKLGHKRIRVTHARPRAKFYGGNSGPMHRGGGSRGGFGDQRCYQCGEVGHFSRNCLDTKFGYKRPPSPGRGSRFKRRSRSPPPHRGAPRYQSRRSPSPRDLKERRRSPSYERKRSRSTSRY